MNTLIVYESAWGNTKAVAEAVATGYSSDDPQVVSVEAAPPLQGREAGLLVVGAPTHAFGLSRAGTREDTHVRHPNLPGAASHSAAKKLRRLGCTLVIDPESFCVDGYEGSLLPGELERARSWRQRAGSPLRCDWKSVKSGLGVILRRETTKLSADGFL